MLKKLIIVLIILFAIGLGVYVWQEGEDKVERSLREAVEEALAQDPPGGYAAIPEGVKLLSIEVDHSGGPWVISLNFNEMINYAHPLHL